MAAIDRDMMAWLDEQGWLRDGLFDELILPATLEDKFWHRWFAWFPIQTPQGWRWLRTVKRRWYYRSHVYACSVTGGWWLYRSVA